MAALSLTQLSNSSSNASVSSPHLQGAPMMIDQHHHQHNGPLYAYTYSSDHQHPTSAPIALFQPHYSDNSTSTAAGCGSATTAGATPMFVPVLSQYGISLFIIVFRLIDILL